MRLTVLDFWVWVAGVTRTGHLAQGLSQATLRHQAGHSQARTCWCAGQGLATAGNTPTHRLSTGQHTRRKWLPSEGWAGRGGRPRMDATLLLHLKSCV